MRIGALGYGTLSAWKTAQIAEQALYVSTNPNDRIVVADIDGVLKVKEVSTILPPTVTVAATNGLTKNITTSEIELGGTLNRATEITTDAANTLALKGLQVGTASDKLVTIDSATGILKVVDQLVVPAEPFNVQNTTNKATSNTENIYQQGNVAIGFTDTDEVSNKKLEVKGDFKSNRSVNNREIGLDTNFAGSGLNALYNVDNLTNPTDFSIVNLNNNVVNVIGRSNVGNSSTQVGPDAALISSQLSAPADGYSVITATPDRIALQNDGPEANAFQAQINLDNTTGVNFAFKENSSSIGEQYTFPKNSGSVGQVLTVETNGAGSSILAWKNTPTPNQAPIVFYAPSIVLPTNPANLQNGVTYDGASGVFTVNLHGIYNAQYGMVGDISGATRSAIKSSTATALPVHAASELEYFVTYFDNTVFDPSSITLSDSGVMTYKIIPSSSVTEKTYMNIVFKVK